MSIESVMPSNHFVLCYLLLLPPSIFPSIRVLSNEFVLTSAFLHRDRLMQIVYSPVLDINHICVSHYFLSCFLILRETDTTCNSYHPQRVELLALLAAEMQARDMNITICTCKRLIQGIQAKRVCDELSFCRWQQSCLAFEVGVLETEFHWAEIHVLYSQRWQWQQVEALAFSA